MMRESEFQGWALGTTVSSTYPGFHSRGVVVGYDKNKNGEDIYVVSWHNDEGLSRGGVSERFCQTYLDKIGSPAERSKEWKDLGLGGLRFNKRRKK